MLPEKLRFLFGGHRAPATPTPARNGGLSRFNGLRSSEKEIVTTRQSRGLEQFFSYIRDQSGLSILDLSGAIQENVSFITNLGHKLYTQDLLRSLNETFGEEDLAEQANPGRIEYFLRQNLDYEDEQFDGVLAWDMLEHMAPALLSATIDRLYRVVRPRSYLLAFFHSDEKLESAPYYSFRIKDFNTLQVVQRGGRKPVQLFNNRSLERLFQRFDSVKFFLTRENLREIIVKR